MKDALHQSPDTDTDDTYPSSVQSGVDARLSAERSRVQVPHEGLHGDAMTTITNKESIRLDVLPSSRATAPVAV